MDISVQKLLGKMEAEIQQARTSHDEARLREKIASIKTLCELILDEAPENKQTPVFMAAQQTGQLESSPQAVLTAKKMNMDEEANGDSLFDF